MQLLLGALGYLVTSFVENVLGSMFFVSLLISVEWRRRAWWMLVMLIASFGFCVGAIVDAAVGHSLLHVALDAVGAFICLELARWLTRPPRRRRPVKQVLGEKSRALLEKLRVAVPHRPGLNPA